MDCLNPCFVLQSAQMANRKLKVDTVDAKNFDSVKVSMSNGWAGRVSLYDSKGNRFEPGHWRRCLVRPGRLCDKPEMTLKSDGSRTVVMQTLEVGDKQVKAVIKSQHREKNFKNLCRCVVPTGAMRSFLMAQLLCEQGISTAWPLVALERRQGAVTVETIFITEFIPDSMNLYHFLRDKLTQDQCTGQLKLKKNLSEQVAGLLGALHNASLWHRDAKAGNFLVQEGINGEYKLSLVDMDGIKSYRIRRSSLRYRSLAKLASTLMWHGGLSRTDYLRTFGNYCTLTSLERAKSKGVFKEIVGQAKGLRLLTMVNEATKGRG